jgi:hypothetical protein
MDKEYNFWMLNVVVHKLTNGLYMAKCGKLINVRTTNNGELKLLLQTVSDSIHFVR